MSSLDPVLPPYNSSDPGASFISTSALDFLLIELVPLAYRITSENPQPSAAGGPLSSPTPNDGVSTTNNTTTANGAVATLSKGIDDEEALDAVKHRLDTAGYRVGQGLVERYGDSAAAPFVRAAPSWECDHGSGLISTAS